ncbi:MAG: hydantoinase/oxoprolinase family protein [Pseudomonadota bacterium]
MNYPHNKKLSVDIGGTFTDVVLASDDTFTTTKVLTTYSDPALGVIEGVKKVLSMTDTQSEEIGLVLHGTTLATNALIERRGAVTGLITTQGHRDVLEMAFENRFEQYDVNIDRTEPLIPRHLRLGIPERMNASGDVVVPLDEEALGRLLDTFKSQAVSSIAVGLLHSYANPDHELRVRDLINQVWPEVSVTLSSEVCPEIREFERFSTTAANAYVRPLMASYLESLAENLAQLGISAQVLLMTSGGGLTTLYNAAQYPIRLVESGPAGGAMLAARVASENDYAQVVSFDMGGTTAKICMIDDGRPLHSRSFEVDRSYRFKKGSGLPVRIPVIEMVEIGAGGGSIASVDALRRLRVGPDSAASEPGPICYDQGGAEPTVTDADLVVGRLPAQGFAGGSMVLNREAALTGLKTGIGDLLRMDVDSAAEAVLEVIEENMAAAARAHASEWGKSMAGRVMIAFGGAAPIHAAALARKLKIRQVLVPAGAGVGSAIGFLMAPVRFEVVRSDYSTLSRLDSLVIGRLVQDMYQEAESILSSAGTEVADESLQAYMRYQGQGYEVAVSVNREDLTIANLQAGFEEEYISTYGRTIPGVPVEILSWTLALSGPEPDSSFAHVATELVQEESAAGSAVIWEGGNAVDARLVPRGSFTPAVAHAGPLLVTEPQTTVYVPTGMSVELTPNGDLLLQESPG